MIKHTLRVQYDWFEMIVSKFERVTTGCSWSWAVSNADTSACSFNKIRNGSIKKKMPAITVHKERVSLSSEWANMRLNKKLSSLFLIFSLPQTFFSAIFSPLFHLSIVHLSSIHNIRVVHILWAIASLVVHLFLLFQQREKGNGTLRSVTAYWNIHRRKRDRTRHTELVCVISNFKICVLCTHSLFLFIKKKSIDWWSTKWKTALARKLFRSKL